MKKYYLITFTHQWNDQEITYNTEAIDVSPIDWMLKWHSGESKGSGPNMYYQQHLLNAIEITEDQYLLFKQKYNEG